MHFTHIEWKWYFLCSLPLFLLQFTIFDKMQIQNGPIVDRCANASRGIYFPVADAVDDDDDAGAVVEVIADDEYCISSCACAMSLSAACIFSRIFCPRSTTYEKNGYRLSNRKASKKQIWIASPLPNAWQPLDFRFRVAVNSAFAILVNCLRLAAIQSVCQCLWRIWK